MPEGDTVHRITRVLQKELQGRTLARLYVRDRGDIAELAGLKVEKITAQGKHMLVQIGVEWILRIHLGMHGTWLRKHVREVMPADITAMLVTDETAYICVGAYRAELMRAGAVRVHPILARLGPDLLADPPDIAEAVRRARLGAHAHREVGELVLDQRIAAGIGNVYKSEVLFECRIHPRTRMRALTEEKVEAIFRRAAELMRLNLLTRRRTAVPLKRRATPSSQRLWVYGRAGKPCLDCGNRIEMFLQGDMARSTYFCPYCQAASGE